MDNLNQFGQSFRTNLATIASAKKAFLKYNSENECFHITDAGKFVSSAYE